MFDYARLEDAEGSADKNPPLHGAAHEPLRCCTVMKFVVTVALCCGFLWSLAQGFVAIKTLTRDEFYGVNSGKVAASDVTAFLNQLVTADSNAAQDGDIAVDYQNMASHTHFDHDNAHNPLFSSVSSSLLGKPTYSALSSLLSQYTTPDSGADETLTPSKSSAASAFLSAIGSTQVFSLTSAFLTKNSLVSGDVNTALTNLWFQPFARSGSVKGSSGFKAVFAGETSAGKVVGFNNWVQFYTLEQANAINYHGWFERQKDIQISLQFAWNSNEALIRDFFVGTSPEFDFCAATVCALSGLSSCEFTLGGYDVSLTVTTVSDNGVTKISNVLPAIGSGGGPVNPTGSSGSKTTKHNGGGSSSPDLQALIDHMWTQDEDKAQPGDVVLDWGNKVSGVHDESPNPLFKHVNEDLFQRPVYKKLIDILNDNLFKAQVCTAEDPMAGLRKAQLDDYLKTLTNTTVFQLAYKYMVAQGAADSDFSTFYKKLFNLWYGTYTRCKGALGSSGWEHVYSGEWKKEEIDGQHNWVRYYLLEKAGDINYHGYFSHENDLIGTFQYTWKSYLKKKGGFFITTSPSFDLAVLTTCVLTHSGASGCKFTVNGNFVAVTSYHQSCNGGECISTAYPSDN